MSLYSILENAIESGADSIEMEFVSEGLEVTYMSGYFGLGEVIEDKETIGEILGELIDRAKLENKSRGTFEWSYGGESYKIRVSEYENFGESAFRLKLK